MTLDKTQKNEQQNQSRITDHEVCQYLEENSDFFSRNGHESLLEKLSLPHDCGKSISLLEYQVEMFRNQKNQLFEQLERIVEINGINQRLLQVIFFAVTEMLTSKNLHQLVTVFYQVWKEKLAVDAVTVQVPEHIEEDRLKALESCGIVFFPFGVQILPKKIQRKIDHGEVVCLPMSKTRGNIFSGAIQSGSFACIPSVLPNTSFCTFLGSTESEKFSPDMQTDLVTFLCQCFSLLFESHYQNKEKPPQRI